MTDPAPKSRFVTPWFTTVVPVVLVALLLRIWIFPHPNEVRDMDEPSYLSGGLLLWEGLTPGHKHAPSAPITWIGWLYAAVMSLRWLAFPSPVEQAVPRAMRPFSAVEHALFDAYHDLSFLRQLVVGCAIAVALAGVYAGYSLGKYRSRTPGAWLGAGLFAWAPVFVTFSDQARPYIFAWSFALIAHALLVVPSRKTQRLRFGWAAFFAGWMLASRVEMVLYLPLLVWQLYDSLARIKPEERPAHIFGKTVAITLATTLVASPWYLTNLLGNLRAILFVRTVQSSSSRTAGIRELFLEEGLAIATLLTLLVPVLYSRSFVPKTETQSVHPTNRLRWALVAILLFYCLDVSRSSGFGIRHHGAALMTVVTMAPLGLTLITDLIQQRMQRSTVTEGITPWAIAVIALVFPLGRTVVSIVRTPKYVPDSAVAWIEQHIPPGTIVYQPPCLQSLLPTTASGDRLWEEVLSRQAWQRKFTHGATLVGQNSGYLPRGLAEESMLQERGLRRRWGILASDQFGHGPRYNLFPMISPTLDEFDEPFPQHFARYGGVMILHGPAATVYGPPIVQWTSTDGIGTYLYYRPMSP